MTTILLGHCIIHDFLITQAILNGEGHISGGARLIVKCADSEEESETAGGTTVYPKWYMSCV